MNEAIVSETRASDTDTCIARSMQAGMHLAGGLAFEHTFPLGDDGPALSARAGQQRSRGSRANIRSKLARARHLLGRLDGAQALVVLLQVERQLALAPAQDVLPLLGEIAAMRAASLVLMDDLSAALAAALSALRLGASSATARLARSVCRYVYWHHGDMEQFEAVTCADVGEHPGRLHAVAAVFDCTLDAMAELRQLRLNSARALAEDALHMARRGAELSLTIDALPASVIAQVLFEQGRLDEAHALVAPRLPHVGRRAMVEGALRCYGLLSRIAASRGEPRRALDLLADAEGLAIKCHWPRLRAASLAQQVQMHLALGSLHDATRCVRRLESLIAACPAQGGTPSFEMARYLAIAHARLALAYPGCPFDAQQLQNMYRDSLLRHDYSGAVEVALLLVEIRVRQQRQDDAEQLLVALMLRAVSVGLMQTLVDCSAEVGELIARFGREDMPSAMSDGRGLRAYASLIDARRKRARHLLQSNGAADVGPLPRGGSFATANLSDRERAIVGLMGQGMTNKEIAMHLRIAPETVKSHAKHLYTKLSVKNRTQAVTVAGQLGLLQFSTKTTQRNAHHEHRELARNL